MRHVGERGYVELGNYSHFNEFKRLTTYAGKPVDDPSAFSNLFLIEVFAATSDIHLSVLIVLSAWPGLEIL